jgi:hypothetical protein
MTDINTTPDAATGPSAIPSRPFYKRWWFILGVLLFIILAAAGGGRDAGVKTAAVEEPVNAPTSPVVSADASPATTAATSVATPASGLGRSRAYFTNKYSMLTFEKVRDADHGERYLANHDGMIVEISGPSDNIQSATLAVGVAASNSSAQKAAGILLGDFTRSINPSAVEWMTEHLVGGDTVIDGQKVTVTTIPMGDGSALVSLTFEVEA